MKRSRDKIPYLTAKKIKGGKTAYYFNLPKRLIPEGCDMKQSYALGCDYLSACEQAIKLNRQLNDFRQTSLNLTPKSLLDIWQRFIKSDKYLNLSKDTAASYRYSYEFLCTIKAQHSGKFFKDIPLDSFTHKAAEKFYKSLLKTTGSIYKSNYCITVLKLLFSFGIYEDIFNINNPFVGIRLEKTVQKKEIYSEEYIREWVKKAREANYQHLALAVELNYIIGQRPEDVVALHSDMIIKYKNFYFFEIEQQKTFKATQKKTYVPIPEYLWDEVLSKQGYIIQDEFGNFTRERLSRHFQKCSKEIGMKLIFKQIRHSASTAYAEADVASNAIISITGHTNETTFEKYYKANTPELSLLAYKKRIAKNEKSE